MSFNVDRSVEETEGEAVAKACTEPGARHALALMGYMGRLLDRENHAAGLMDYTLHIRALADAAEKGDLSIASKTLAAQAVILDSMFTEFARRASMNMSQYLDAAERFARLALKSQANSRATLEALARLHQPREQTVRHVHVNEGGQAIVADQFHQHLGGTENGKEAKQSHATGSTCECPSLPCTNAQGDSLPITSGEREAALPDARRNESGCAHRK